MNLHRVVSLATFALCGAIALNFSACTKKQTPPAGGGQSTDPNAGLKIENKAAPNANEAANVTELKIEEMKAGTGAEATPGKQVAVHYTGWLTSGKKFDSSLDRGAPFKFQLGAGQVIPGWDKGVAGMKISGKRKLTIPASMGYGARGAGDVIPPNATLIFEVELLGVE